MTNQRSRLAIGADQSPSPWQPVELAANQPPRPYRGGAGIARFRGTAVLDEFRPEDFVGSTTEVASGGGVGLSRLADTRLLRDVIAADPVAFLGPSHAAVFGADPALLVKLLDTGERLFLHYHPTAPFAREHLRAPRGKNEAWIVIGVDRAQAEPCAYVGFERDVGAEELRRWFDAQDGEAMLGAMNRVQLGVGDVLFVPASLPHAIGAGVTIVELQEPSDLSIILEYENFAALDAATALLGMSVRTALSGVRRTSATADLSALLVKAAAAETCDGVRELLPGGAAPYFRAQWVSTSSAQQELDAGFSIVVVASGAGRLSWQGGERAVRSGQTLLLPYALGPCRVSGQVNLIRCLPPDPAAAVPVGQR
jgi:mannose-6-phosphate isomerase